jgi:hypothetical protein
MICRSPIDIRHPLSGLESSSSFRPHRVPSSSTSAKIDILSSNMPRFTSRVLIGLLALVNVALAANVTYIFDTTNAVVARK